MSNINNSCPTTRKELHEYIQKVFGLYVPNKKICPNHNSPFKFLSDAFFETDSNKTPINKIIAIANRGGGKSINLSLKTALDSRFKPGCETAILGALEHHAIRCHEHFKRFIQPYVDEGLVKEALMKKTVFEHPINSIVEILTGTTGGVNAPHTPKLSIDEFELMEWNIFQEALNIPVSKNDVKIQVILASTRKYAYGTVEKLLRSDRKNKDYRVYTWCVWECIEKCQKPSCDECKKIVKGSYSDGSPRSFYSVCQGKAKQACGYRKIDEDVINKFLTLDIEMWEAQQECKRPTQKGSVFYWFDEKKHVTTFDIEPHAEYYESIDWGAKDPNVCLYWMVKDGKYYLFDEIYKENISPSEFAKLILEKRDYWGIGKKIEKTYCDPSARSARLELANFGIETIGVSGLIIDGIRIINSLGCDDRIIMHKRCINSRREWPNYHYNENSTSKVPVDKENHTIDPTRYLFTKLNPIGYNSGGDLMSRVVFNDSEKQKGKNEKKRIDKVGLFHSLAEELNFRTALNELNDIIRVDEW